MMPLFHGTCFSFTINIGHDPENVAMHLDGRFDHCGDCNTIVFNSQSGGSWGDECREDRFPFSPGEECKVCTVKFLRRAAEKY